VDRGHRGILGSVSLEANMLLYLTPQYDHCDEISQSEMH
jgi:hypothetical protein